MKSFKLLVSAFILFLFFQCHLKIQSQTTIALDSTVLEVTTVASGLHVPWELLWGPDDWLWVTERNGRISRINPETGEQQLLVTIPDCYEYSESGLLGMALHPDFANNPYVYVVHNYYSGGNREKLVRYTYNGSALVDPLVLISGIMASGGGNHSGSRLLILPDQTMLMSTGDYYNDVVAQDVANINGKILRLNLDGSVPADNPIAGSYVHSWGHRNAQGMVRAPNGIIYSSEHGPSNDDEFNILLPNRNYGWPNVEGFCNTTSENAFCTANDVVEPLAAWTPTVAVCGIDYYNHPAIPEWQNSILMADLKAPSFKQLQLDQAGTGIVAERNIVNDTFGRLRDVCVAPDGRVFIATSNQDGRAASWAGFPQPDDDKILQLRNPNWMPTLPQANFAHEDSCLLVHFTNLSADATSFSWLFGNGYGSLAENPTYLYTQPGTYTVQLIATNQYASDSISFNVTVSECFLPGIDGAKANNPIKIYPNPLTGNALVQYPPNFAGGVLEVVDAGGKTVRSLNLPETETVNFNKDNLASGIYYLKITKNGNTVSEKLIVQ